MEKNASSSKKTNNKNKSNKSNKTSWVVIAILVGIAVAVGVLIGIFTSKPSDGVGEDGCPGDQEKVCMIVRGEKVCECMELEKKPIIYLYPEEKTELTVRLGAPENLTSSYPKYEDGWDVIAYPNGDLVDKKTGNKYYSLYWEGNGDYSELDKSVGFVVKGEDSAKFLEEKLEKLGLNYREKEEFIVYWLPILEANKYNYIYFANQAEIDAAMPLELSVKPDTTIRVRMLFEGLDEYREVREQELTPAPSRDGFTVVEWGGIEM